VLGTLPFGAMGFVKYNGMSAEQFIPAYLKSEFLMPKHLMIQSENIYYAALRECIAKGGKYHD
jgi:hypothetical protein